MQVPSSILKKMAIGASSLALTTGAVYAVTNPANHTQSDDAPIAQCAPPATPEPTVEPTMQPIANVGPTFAPRLDPFLQLQPPNIEPTAMPEPTTEPTATPTPEPTVAPQPDPSPPLRYEPCGPCGMG